MANRTRNVGLKLLGTYIVVVGLVFILTATLPIMGAGSMEERIGQKQAPIAERLTMNKTGHTDAFGGGNYVGISNKDNDAWIAVIYGTSAAPNSIVVVSHYTRYLGAVDVYDSSGGLIAKNRPIRVSTVFAQRFDTIYEFNDTNDDGICNAIRRNLPLRPSDITWHEPVYKAVSLNASWERSEVTKTRESDSVVEWEFSLTAKDLPYKVLGDPALVNASVGDGKLNIVRLTFHLQVTRKVVNTSVPIFKVGVSLDKERRESGVESTERLTNRTFTATTLDADIKYDHYIEGWDFDPHNANPALVFETHMLMGMAMPTYTYQWMNEQYLENNIKGSEGEVEYDAAGEGSVSVGADEFEDNNTATAPKILNKNRLQFRDNWQSIGGLKWVSNVTVYDNATDTTGHEDDMYFMLYGGVRIRERVGGLRFGGKVFRGLAVMGGWSYPAGYKLVHDPTYTCSMVTPDIQEESGSGGGGSEGDEGGESSGGFIPGFEAFAIVSAIGVVTAILTIYRKKQW